VVVAGVDRALFASGSTCLGVGSNALKQILPDYSTVTLRSGLTAARDLSYAPVGDRVYYSNGVELGVVAEGASRSWGLPVPALPVAAATGGDLPEGTYQYVVTYIRSDGQESGAARAGTITLTATGGIDLSAIPVSSDTTVVAKAVYVSTRNGAALYRAGTIANATTTLAVREAGDPASPLQTQFLTAPPTGDFIGYFSGWMLVADGDRLYPSEPYAPELFDVRKAMPFSDRITMVAPVEKGVWIGTGSQVIWLNGDSPETWKFDVRADYGVIPGTLAYGDSELIGAKSGKTISLSVKADAPVPFFSTTRGLCVGEQDGELRNFTEARFAYPSQPVGAGVVRRHRGLAQYLVTLNGPETAGNTFA
ncbi:MAG: hypothetical protein Q7R41_20485, partial [Phycisphaerales bacterium]|nr:hypothetical protein [Phycisphaerales bacterium]